MRRGRGTSSGCSLGWLVMREEQGVRLAEVTITPGTGLVKVRGQYESGFDTSQHVQEHINVQLVGRATKIKPYRFSGPPITFIIYYI